MLAGKSIGWWYWLATAVLLTGYLAGLPGAREVAAALLVMQVAHFRRRERSFLAFPVQVRVAYLAIFIAGMAPDTAVLHWIQTIGVWVEVLAGYCLLARLLALLPWNRAAPLTLGLVRFVLFSPPGHGSILGALAEHDTAGGDEARSGETTRAAKKLELHIDGGEARAVVGIALPMAGVGLVNMGMSITDTIMIGWLGTTELAAGTVVSDLYSIVFYMTSGVLLALGPMIAEAIGAGRDADIRRTVRQGLVAAAIVAAPAALAVLNTDLVLRAFGVGENIVAMGRGYAEMSALTIVAMLFVAVWRNVFAACGHPRVFLVATLLALPLNAVLNGVLMYGWGPLPAFGLTGAGMASAGVAGCLAIGLGAFAAVNPSMRRYDLFRHIWRVDVAKLRELFRIGLPIGLSSLAEYGIWLISTVTVSLFGAEILAAHAIALRMAGVVYSVPVSLSQAASIRVGYAVGKDDDAALRRSVSTAMTVGIAATATLLATLIALRDVIPLAFLSGSVAGAGEVSALASMLLVLLGVVILADGPLAIAVGVLRGLKDTRAPLVLAVVGYWVVGAPLGLLLGFSLGWGAVGVWSGILAGISVTGMLSCTRLQGRLAGGNKTAAAHIASAAYQTSVTG